MMFGAIVHGGPDYRELMEAVHVLRYAWENAKEFAEELVEDDEHGNDAG
jgi:hypothetical protein